MAATAILSPSADSPFMASRQRLPLSNAPNLANSPYRATNGKRLRSQAVDERENADAYPPKKRLAVESGVKSLRRHDLAAVDDAAGNVFTGKPERHIPNSFNRRLNSVREAGKTQAAAAGDKTTDKHLQSEEQLRVWRRHYRKIFPSFVFFFESLPQDVSVRAARQIARLGAVRFVTQKTRVGSKLTTSVERGKVLFQGSHSHRHPPGHSSRPGQRR